MKEVSRSNDGFTLIELLIVLIVLGILASIGTLSLKKSQRNASVIQCAADISVLDSAVLQWASDQPSGTTLVLSGLKDLVSLGYYSVSTQKKSYDLDVGGFSGTFPKSLKYTIYLRPASSPSMSLNFDTLNIVIPDAPRGDPNFKSGLEFCNASL